MRADLVPGNPFPELELPDHSGVPRTLTELAEGDPVVLTSTAGGAPRSRRSSARWCGCRRSWRSPTRGWCRSASTRRPSRPPSGPVSAPGGRSCPTRSAGTSTSSACGRRPTRSTGRTCRPRSRCSRTGPSTPSTTATGSGGANRQDLRQVLPAVSCGSSENRSQRAGHGRVVEERGPGRRAPAPATPRPPRPGGRPSRTSTSSRRHLPVGAQGRS